MKKMIQLGQKGFTLVELMIVVAIIGILAAVGIPQYSKFQSKARQSDSKVGLGAVYTVEATFRAEAGSYISCLNQIGFTPMTQSYYNMGFGTGTAIYTVAGNPITCAGTQAVNGNINFTATRNGVAGGALPVTTTGTGTVAAATFSAVANGVIANGGINQWDTWTINENQVLSNTSQGY